MDLDSASSLIARIYGAATAPSPEWQPILQQIVAATSARTGWMHSWQRAPSLDLHVLGSVGVTAEALEAYRDHYCAIDPWCAAVLRLPAGQLMLSHEHVAPESYDRTEIFNEYVRPHLDDTTFIATVAIPLGGSGFASLGLHRLRSAGPFEAAEVAILTMLLPHLQGAMAIRQRIGDVERERRLAAAILDRLAIPAIVVDPAGRALFLNKAAERLLARADGLGLSQRILKASGATAHASLARAIWRAAGRNPRASTVRVVRPSGAGAWVVLAAPISTIGESDGKVVIFISEPASDPPAERDLMGAFVLTQAEARVARALAAGQRVDQIASTHGVAVATIRTQLSALFAKSGTTGQADLTRLLMTLPRLHHPDD